MSETQTHTGPFTVELAKWHDEPEMPDKVRPVLFGELVKLATPTLRHYHSDLYYDAKWLDEHVQGVTEFIYSFDDMGTRPVTQKDARELDSYPLREVAYWVKVTHDQGVWGASFTPIDTETP